MPIEPGDDEARIVEKAANIVPRQGQIAWQQREILAFTHFGVNTFTNLEWGTGMEDPAIFNPPEVDVAQWMVAYQAMGAKLAILTAKHHDGFCLYPTRYTPHRVTASPWGRDILGPYAEAAREAGLRVGVYLSPADGAELPHQWHAETYVPSLWARPADDLSPTERATLEAARAQDQPSGLGRYGNGSTPTARVIPTLVEGDDRADAVADGTLPSFEVTADDYNAYYLNQLYELFTEYGPIDELWMDGANPWPEINQPYDFTTWFQLIKALAPDTVVFGGPQGTRWVGNEGGVARETEWSVVPATGDPDTGYNEFMIPGGATAEDIASRAVLADPSVQYIQWYPAEADFSIRPGWFYHADQAPKTPAELLDRYHSSVGRNAVMLMNIPPAPDGLIDQADIDAATGFTSLVDSIYGTNLLAAYADADPVIADLTDNTLTTGASGEEIALTLPSPVTFDRIRLGEDLTRGQHVEEFAVDADDATVTTGTTIGYSRILLLSSPVTTSRLRIRILATRAEPHLSFLGLYTADDTDAD
jgi:alpha-L-fucosidase